jgi:hypothetical protein
VVLNTRDYIAGILTHLADRDSYVLIPKDPIKKWETDTRDLIKSLKIDKDLKNSLMPCGSTTPRFYGLPKIHKVKEGEIPPMRPVMAFVNAPITNLTKWAACIIKRLLGKTEHTILNGEDFKDRMTDVSLEEDEMLVSYDVKSLYPSIPILLAIESVDRLIDKSPDSLIGHDANSLKRAIRFCLENSFCVFQNQHYRQIKGLPMGSPLSTILAEVVMGEVDQIAVDRLQGKVRKWGRYIDDVSGIVKRNSKIEALSILNGINENIQFTSEEERDGTLPFLDVEMKRTGAKLEFSVYRKPSHTGGYLPYDSEHPHNQKMGVVRSLVRRIHTHCSSDKSKETETLKVIKDLRANGFPMRLIQEELNKKFIKTKEPKESQPIQNTIAIPYVTGLGESLRRILNKIGTEVVWSRGTTLKDMTCNLKDKLALKETPNAIYRIPCGECAASYLGESKRRLGDRIVEHERAIKNLEPEKSAWVNHINETSHMPDWKKLEVLDVERNWSKRRFKEAIFIMKEEDPINRNEGLGISEIFKPMLLKGAKGSKNKFRANTNRRVILPNF